MKTLLLSILAGSVLYAQGLTEQLSSATVKPGGTDTLSVTYVAGSGAAAAIQWAISWPAGVTAVWSVGTSGSSANKTLTCSGTGISPQVCVLAALNTTTIAAGIVASAVLTFGAGVAKGVVPLNLATALGASPAGSGVSLTAGTIAVTVNTVSRFDLNADGLVNAADFALAMAQVIGSTTCGTADFNGDGVCNVEDLILLAVDSVSVNP